MEQWKPNLNSPFLRLQNAALFLKLAWYALWNWACIAYREQEGNSVPDAVGEGENTMYNLYIKAICIDTTTKWYLLKRIKKC